MPNLIIGACPLRPAGSTGRCNTGVKSLCGGFESQGLTWPFVELTRYFVQRSRPVARTMLPRADLRSVIKMAAKLYDTTRMSRYYNGPVSDHFDGARVFDPHSVPP